MNINWHIQFPADPNNIVTGITPITPDGNGLYLTPSLPSYPGHLWAPPRTTDQPNLFFTVLAQPQDIVGTITDIQNQTTTPITAADLNTTNFVPLEGYAQPLGRTAITTNTGIQPGPTYLVEIGPLTLAFSDGTQYTTLPVAYQTDYA